MDDNCYGSNDNDFWLGYMMGQDDPNNDNPIFLWLVKLYFFGFPAGKIGYDIGKLIYDVNIVKWGFAILFVIASFVFIGKLIFFIVEKVIDNFYNDAIRIILGLVVSLIIALFISYLISIVGHYFFVDDETFTKYISNYENLVTWLLSKS